MKDFRWRQRARRPRTQPLLALPSWVGTAVLVVVVLLACGAAATVMRPFADQMLAAAGSPAAVSPAPPGATSAARAPTRAATAQTAAATAAQALAQTAAPAGPTQAAPTSAPSAQPTVPPAPTDVPAPTAVPAPTDVPAPTEPPSQPVAVGLRVRVAGTNIGLSLRRGPSLQEPLVRVAPDGEEFSVVDGPQQADGYTWWKLHNDTGADGWGAADFLYVIAP